MINDKFIQGGKLKNKLDTFSFGWINKFFRYITGAETVFFIRCHGILPTMHMTKTMGGGGLSLHPVLIVVFVHRNTCTELF